MEAYSERENDRRTSRQNHGAVRDGLGVNVTNRAAEATRAITSESELKKNPSKSQVKMSDKLKATVP